MTDRKVFTPELKAAGDDGTATFVLARLNDHIDEDGDVTLSGFFGRQPAMFVPVHDWKHVPIGKGVVYETSNEALVDVRFNLAIEAARDWHAAIKFDLENPPPLQEYSYGYNVLPGGSRMGEFGGRPVRFLQPLKDGSPGVDVIEVSPVMLGAAGRGVTRTLAAKHATTLTDDELAIIREAERHVHAHIFAEAEKHLRAYEASRWEVRPDERAELEAIRRKFYTELSDQSFADAWHGTHELTYIDETKVAGWKRRLVEATTSVIADRLGVPTPTVRWFTQRKFSLYGRAYVAYGLHGVAVNADLSNPMDLMKTAAHEVGHLAGMNEAACRGFERVFEAELTGAAA